MPDVAGPSVVLSKKGNRLSGSEREALFRDELLGRFAWVYKGGDEKFWGFQNALVEEARKDGYALSFTEISGGDRWSGSGAIEVTSDLTRASALVRGEREKVRLEGYGKWREILPKKIVEGESKGFYWPCWKFQGIASEASGDEGVDK